MDAKHVQNNNVGYNSDDDSESDDESVSQRKLFIYLIDAHPDPTNYVSK